MKISALAHGMATLLLGVILAGCTTATPIVSEWRNPSYGAVAFNRVMVAGPAGSAGQRRNVEDEFLTQLHGAGIDAVASYRYLAEDDKLEVGKLKEVARQARADALIVVGAVRVEEKSQMSGGFAPPISFGIFGSHVGASWSGLGSAPSTYRYSEYTAETTLHDVAKNDLVWSGTTKTSEPESERGALKSTVDAVVKSLIEKNLLRRRSNQAAQ